MNAEATRTCLACGVQFPATQEFCPICMLREALGAQVEAAKPPLKERRPELTPRRRRHRFQHYELVIGKDRKPVELGRGAMGVTYKALDIELRCLVTLKVINKRYLGDESARLRFLREARTAAKVRHSNVASVLHLGRTRSGYFYAMEFVEGETVEHLSKRCGRLEVHLALEIATQVAAGLAAVHKQKLVHRDIKPSNIMVNLEEGGAVTAKIIDLGLAKAVNEPGSQTAISTPGGFAGTPEFASPEQFAGIEVDIRSDLYSLGVTLWEMVTGKTPFWGTPAEVMHQHQHAALPIGQLESVPQPIIVLLEILLDKDPCRRFQNPVELLRAIPTITGAIDARSRVTRQSLHKAASMTARAETRKSQTRSGPDKISVARLPVTGSDVFGREEDIAFLDRAWATRDVNIVTIVAWAGVGKSTLVNHWLRRMATGHYHSAEVIFGWSFYRQGTSGDTSSADEFLDAALTWFGDQDARLGTAWEKGERLAKFVAARRSLLILDGLEPLQNPPGPQEGRIREPSLQAFLRELAAFNRGLCLITTRLPVADITDREGSSALRRELEHLSSDAGGSLLRALGVKGDEAELRSASEEFTGHCLALTLLGSYLTDAYRGDIRCRKEVSEHLAHDVRKGVYARKVMHSYQSWFGDGPELAILRMLGLFDRPVDEKALAILLNPPAIRGLTETLVGLSVNELRAVLGRLRRARLLAGDEPQNRGFLDTHPLVREYFGEQLRSLQNEAWRECNKRLYNYYRALAPALPDSIRAMEPLFLATIFGCNAGLFRQALHEVYIPRIQRGNASFAANVLGARGALLSILAHFFERGRWGSFIDGGLERQDLSVEDQLFVITQARLYLIATRGLASLEARNCCQRAELLCRSLDQPALLYSTLKGQFFYSLMTSDLTATMQMAKRLYCLAKEHDTPALMLGAYDTLVTTLYFSGRFDAVRKSAILGLRIWRSGKVQSQVEEVIAPAVVCLLYKGVSEWHFGHLQKCTEDLTEASLLAKELNDMQGSVFVLYIMAHIAHFAENASEVERLASDMMELSTRQNVGTWLPHGRVLRGWARSASGKIAEGLSSIEDGIVEYRAAGAIVALPFFQTLKAEALHLAGRTSEALAALEEGETVVERSGARVWSAELRRLRGVFLAILGADEAQIEASFRTAISTAGAQKSSSLTARAEASYLEYRRKQGRVSER